MFGIPDARVLAGAEVGVEDRIVQRAILNVLQDAKDMPRVQQVLATPTSIGGIRGRGVDDAIGLFDKCYADGAKFVAGSDISAFFTKISRPMVIAFIRQDTDEEPFLDLLDRALTVELSNAASLSDEDRKLFPTGTDGVAQGCPLSALAGNIVLAEFDQKMNAPGRGVTCIRYIDDFILIAATSAKVRGAMASAKAHLATLGMGIYDPATDPKKAFCGPIGQPHVFLGYEIVPGQYRPSASARDALLGRIDVLLRDGRKTIARVINENYFRPCSAMPVCRSCHRLLHRRFYDPIPWLTRANAYSYPGAWFTKISMVELTRAQSLRLAKQHDPFDARQQ